MTQTAKEIYQDNLDAVSRALWDRDLDFMLVHIALPNMMITLDSTVVIRTRAEMEEAMLHFRNHLANIGVGAYHRIANSAGFLPGRRDTIVGLHDTYIMRGGAFVVEPIPNQMTLLKIDGLWKGARIEAMTRNSDCPFVSPDMAVRQRNEDIFGRPEISPG